MSRESFDTTGFASSSRQIYETLYFTPVDCPIFRGEVDLLTCRGLAFDKVDIKQCVSSRCQSVIRPCPVCLVQGEFDRIGICEGTFRKPGKDFCDLHLKNGPDYMRTDREASKTKIESVSFTIKPQKRLGTIPSKVSASEAQFHRRLSPESTGSIVAKPVKRVEQVAREQVSVQQPEGVKELSQTSILAEKRMSPLCDKLKMSDMYAGRVINTGQNPLVSTYIEEFQERKQLEIDDLTPSVHNKEDQVDIGAEENGQLITALSIDESVQSLQSGEIELKTKPLLLPEPKKEQLKEATRELDSLEVSDEDEKKLIPENDQSIKLDEQEGKGASGNFKAEVHLQLEKESPKNVPDRSTRKLSVFLKTVVKKVSNEGYSAIKKARAIARLKDNYGYTFAEIAVVFNESMVTTRRYYILLRLHPKIQKMLGQGLAVEDRLTFYTAVYVADYAKDYAQQLELVKEIKRRGLGVMAAREYILTQVEKPPSRSARRKAIGQRVEEINVIEIDQPEKTVLAQAEKLPDESRQQAIASGPSDNYFAWAVFKSLIEQVRHGGEILNTYDGAKIKQIVRSLDGGERNGIVKILEDKLFVLFRVREVILKND